MGPYKFKKPRDVELSANVANDSTTEIPRCLRHVCFIPMSGHSSSALVCRLRADFVVEVGDDRCVATGANFFK